MNFALSAANKVFAGRYEYPAWRKGLAPNVYQSVVSNTISSLDPANDASINPNFPSAAPWRGAVGLSSLITAWCGAAWLDDGLYIWGGGHADYAGNELYRWTKATGQFERLTLPTGAIGNTGTLNDGLESSGVYFDGQPRSYHTYNNFAVRNGVLWCFGGSAYISGNPVSRPYYYDAQTNAWVMDADVSCGATYGATVYDSTRDIFWIFRSGNNQLRYYDPNTKTVTITNRYNDINTYCAAFYDEQSDCLIYADNSNFRVIPADMSANNVISSQINKQTLNSLPTRGIAYDPVKRRFFVRGDGIDVWQVAIPANPRTEQFTWSQIKTSGSLSTAQANGTYGRWWYSHKLRCIGVIDAVTAHMHILPLE